MCDFCENKTNIEFPSKTGGLGLSFKLDEENEQILKMRIEQLYTSLFVGITKPIVVNYCMFCGRKLSRTE